MTTLNWQKSSFSSGDPNTTCVEIATGAAWLHLRESDEPDVVLSANAVSVSGLLAWMKGDRGYEAPGV